MTQDLTFYTNPMSRGRIVRWMLEEIGQPYRTEVLEYGTTMKSREYLAINPMGKVPAIRHDGKIVTEAAAICAYLADAFPQAHLAPPVSDRAAYYRWLFFFAGVVEAAGANRSLGFEVPPDKERMIGYGNFASVVDSIERAVSAGPYIAGDSFTAADVYCGAQIGWGMQFESIERRPAFEAYFRRVSQRPAYARAAELDDALAKQS
jgi:glutathione S-transferase